MQKGLTIIKLLGTLCVAGALALGGFVSWPYLTVEPSQREPQRAAYELTATQLAQDLEPVLKVHDKSLTQESLRSLAAHPWAQGAAVYGVSGKMFTVYARSQEAKRFLPMKQKVTASTSDSEALLVVSPLMVGGKRWGDLLVVATPEPHPVAPRGAPLSAGVGALVLLVAGSALLKDRNKAAPNTELQDALRYPLQDSLDLPDAFPYTPVVLLDQEEPEELEPEEPEVDLNAPVVFHKASEESLDDSLGESEDLRLSTDEVPTVQVRTGPATIPPTLLAAVSERKEQVVDFTTEDIQSLAERGGVPLEDPEDGHAPAQDERVVLFLAENGEFSPDFQVINLATLAKESGEDVKIAKARLKNFLISSRLEVMTMWDAQAAGRTDRLFLEAQALYRSAAQLGADQFTEILDAVMNAVSMNHLDALPLLLKRVDHSHARLLRAVERRLKLVA